MAFEIKIIEGHDPSSYFWFPPVIVQRADRVTYNDVLELDEEFSIEEGDVDCFLSYFFYKYFDEELNYNKNRDEGEGFEWYLTHNFFTYDSVKSMLQDISRTADRLEANFDDPSLDEVKESFSIFYLCPQDSADWQADNQSAVRKYVGVITDFYRRFVARITRMMENNPTTTLISIMGP